VTGTYANSGNLTVATLLTVTSPGVLTNNGTITATTALSGTGTLTQGANSTLDLGGTSGITTLTATASGNTVNYTDAAQTVKAVSYANLVFSGSGAKSMATGTSVAGNLSIAPTGSATASVGAGLDISVGSLTLGGVPVVSGTWGSTTATSAANQNNTYFAATTGYLTVSTGSSTQLIVTLPGQTFTSGTGNSGTVSSQTAGTPFNITLTAVDGDHYKDTTYTGSKTVTYSGPANAPGGATPTYTTTVTFTSGQATSVATTLVDAQSTTITASSSGLTGVASSSLTVNAATASVITFVQGPPASVTDTVAMSPAVTVEVTDTYGNPIGGASVTMSLNSGTGTLTGGSAQSTATGTGIATFSGLSVNLIGNKTLKATVTSPSLSVVSGSFTVVLGPIASYSVTAATPQTRGTPFNVTVTALDAGGNTVTTDNSDVVTMTSSTGNVQFTGNPATPANGTFIISASDNFFETVTITATDANSITGTSSSITINPASGDYRSQATGNWGTAGTWQTWSGSAWVTASSAPTSGTFTGEINVQGGFTVTVNASESVPDSLFVLNSGSTVSISSSETLTVGNGLGNGVIEGSGVLAESGTGNLLTLNGANTYSGGTTITGGTVSVTNVTTSGNQNLGTGGIGFAGGGTLLCDGTGAQTTAAAITLGSGGGVISMSVNTIYLSGTISGGGGLTSGGSDLILEPGSANNIGTMTVNSGRLFVNSANAIANSAVLNINSGGTLDFQYTATPLNTMTFASGSCLANRSSTLTVSTTHVTFPTAGTMIFNQDDLASDPITVSGTYPALTGPLTIQVGGDNATVGTVTLTGAISGSGGLTKTSTGTLVLDSANSYTGGTTVSLGSLTAEVTGSLGSSTGSLSVASGATMTLTSGTTETAATLFLGVAQEPAGSWGSTASSATHTSSTYFGTTATGLLNVSAGPASQIVFTTQPSASTVAGVAFATQPVVKIEDASGNVVTSGADSTATVTLTLTTGTGTLAGTTSVAAVAGVANFSGEGLNINLVGNNKVLTATATVTAGTETATTSPAFTITFAPASQVVFTTQPSASTVAGVAFATQPVVTIEDQFGNTVTSGSDSTVSVALTLTTGTGTLGGTTSMAAVAGVANFSGKGLNINLAGNNKVLTATATVAAGTKTTTTSPAFTITFAQASQVVFTTQPSASTVAGVAFATQPVVTIEDQFGNTVTSGSDSTVSVALTLTTGTGTLGGTTSMAAAAGVANFSGEGLNINLTGNNKVLTATATVAAGTKTTTTSPAFTITPATANAYIITAATTSVTPAVADALTIYLVDQYGNTVTSFTGNKILTFSGLDNAVNGTQPTVTDLNGNAVALGNATTNSFTNGVLSAGGSLLAYYAETKTLAATDGSFSTTNTGGAGVSLTIANVSPVADNYTVTRSPSLDLIVPVSTVMASNTDANGDNLTFVGLTSTNSTQGATLSTNGSYIFYLPNSVTNNDTFSFIISNGFGLTATGTVTVMVVTPGGVLQSAAYNSTNDTALVTGFGIPGLQYSIERSSSPSGPWTNIATITNVSGPFSYTDTNAPPASAYYVLVQH
jgi:hypothetical protein